MSVDKKELMELFVEMEHHLDYCGYGDSWERECAGDLPERVSAMLEAVEKELMS